MTLITLHCSSTPSTCHSSDIQYVTLSEDSQSVARWGSLGTTGPASTHRLEHVCHSGHLGFSHTDNYASSVLDYINTTINSVTTLKQITTCPNQKLWMIRKVQLLLKACSTAFRWGDAGAYGGLRNILLTLILDKCGKVSRPSLTINLVTTIRILSQHHYWCWSCTEQD